MKATCPLGQNLRYHTHFTLSLELTSWVNQGRYGELKSWVCLMAAKKSVPGLILSSSSYLRSALGEWPFWSFAARTILHYIYVHTTRCKLHSTHCTLHTTYCKLNYTVRKLQYTHCKFYATHNTLHPTHCTLHTKQCTLHSTHFKVKVTRCTLHTTHWTLHITHCTLHTTYYTLLTTY